MKLKIGIPGGMFYYYYYPLWKTFFEDLGAEVVEPEATNRTMVEKGIAQAVDEACFPVKVYYGHVAEMCQKNLDYIFLPRIMSLEPRTFTCPKIMGLPAMVTAGINNLPTVIDMPIDCSKGLKDLKKTIIKVGNLFTNNKKTIIEAYYHACQEEKNFRDIAARGFTLSEAIAIWKGEKNISLPPQGDLNIGLLGHAYALYDPIISMSIVENLQEMGCRVHFLEMLDINAVEKEAASLPKRVFWTIGRKMLGASMHMNKKADIDGLVFLSCFGCGPDSMVSELIERKYFTKPFMRLTVDEHTGQAGVITRLEAFCDMLRRRRTIYDENNLSAYG